MASSLPHGNTRTRHRIEAKENEEKALNDQKHVLAIRTVNLGKVMALPIT